MNNNYKTSIFTSEQREDNSRILKYFTYAFTSHSIREIEELLHPDGTFFGKYTRDKAAGIFHSIFFGESGIRELHMIHINRGWSIYPFSGSEVIEFRCSDGDPFEAPKMRKKFGQPQDDKSGEKVYRFCFEFRDELIYRLELPRRFLAQDQDMVERN